jgi:hypothetical protein
VNQELAGPWQQKYPHIPPIRDQQADQVRVWIMGKVWYQSKPLKPLSILWLYVVMQEHFLRRHIPKYSAIKSHVVCYPQLTPKKKYMCVSSLHYLYFCSVFFGSTGVSPFLWWVFSRQGLENYLPGAGLKPRSSRSLPLQVARITDVSHWPLAFLVFCTFKIIPK